MPTKLFLNPRFSQVENNVAQTGNVLKFFKSFSKSFKFCFRYILDTMRRENTYIHSLDAALVLQKHKKKLKYESVKVVLGFIVLLIGKKLFLYPHYSF